MFETTIKKVDFQGRVLLPLEWRKTYLENTNEVIIITKDNRLEIIPGNADLSRFIDTIEVEVKEWNDYHKLRKELRERKKK